MGLFQNMKDIKAGLFGAQPAFQSSPPFDIAGGGQRRFPKIAGIHGVFEVRDKFYIVVPVLQILDQRAVFPADRFFCPLIIVYGKHLCEYGAQALMGKGRMRIGASEEAAVLGFFQH